MNEVEPIRLANTGGTKDRNGGTLQNKCIRWRGYDKKGKTNRSSNGPNFTGPRQRLGLFHPYGRLLVLLALICLFHLQNELTMSVAFHRRSG